MKFLLLTLLIPFLNLSLLAEEQDSFDIMERFVKPEKRKPRLKKLIKKRKYKEAHAQFHPDGIKESHIGLKITYDILNAVLTPDSVKKNHYEFLCEDQLRSYPNAKVYSMELCKLLVSFKAHGSIKSSEFEKTKNFIKKTAKKKLYLLSPLEGFVK